MPSLESAARAVYEAWHPRVQSDSAEANRPWHTLILKHLAPRDIEGRLILEIGCGRGELARRLSGAERGPGRLIAADLAQAAVRLGRHRVQTDGHRHVSWAVASMCEIPAADSTFDTVISCETIEHVAEPLRALTEVHRVLRPGGRLLLTTPNYLGPMGLYRGYLRLTGRRYTEGGQPICHLTSIPRTLRWIHLSGLRLQSVDAIGHYLPWPGRPPRALPVFDSIRLLRWFALHSLVVAEKP